MSVPLHRHRLRICVEALSVEAELNDSRTAAAVVAALPLEASANRWGEEIYFEIPVDAGPEQPQELVALGDLGYWPPGKAFCIFFGRTPVSRGNEIRPASAVNLIGRVVGDPTVFRAVRDGARVRLETA